MVENIFIVRMNIKKMLLVCYLILIFICLLNVTGKQKLWSNINKKICHEINNFKEQQEKHQDHQEKKDKQEIKVSLINKLIHNLKINL